jgi:hypothetical protein
MVDGWKLLSRQISSPRRFGKISFVGGFSASLAGSSGGFENQDAAVFQMDFGCLPCLALVESFWIRIGWIPGTVEPKIRSSNEDFHRKGAEVAEGTLRRVCVSG